MSRDVVELTTWATHTVTTANIYQNNLRLRKRFTLS